MRAFSTKQIKIAVDSMIDSMEMSTIMEIVTDERMDYYCNHADDYELAELIIEYGDQLCLDLT